MANRNSSRAMTGAAEAMVTAAPRTDDWRKSRTTEVSTVYENSPSGTVTDAGMERMGSKSSRRRR